MNKAEEISNWLLTGEVEEIDLFEAAELIRQQAEQINNLLQWQRRQLDVIEAQQAEIEALKQRCWDLEDKLGKGVLGELLRENELLKKLAVPDEARQKLHEMEIKK